MLDGGCCQAQPVETHENATHVYKTIDTLGLKNLLNTKQSVVILDARSGPYDDGKRIPGAKSLSPETTAEQAATLIPAKDSLVVVYCTNLQCPAGKWLAQRLLQLGYSNVAKYAEGIEGWVAAGNSVQKAS